MQINFFEEFPTLENLAKLKMLRNPVKLYLAAPNLSSLHQVQSQLPKKRLKRVIYWPTLSKKEGYWISPFSQRKALNRIFQELQGQNIPVMLDLELPTTQNPLLYLTQLPFFFSNRRMIRKFIQTYPGEIYLAEYYPEGKRKERLLQILGLHYSSKNINIIKMMYHSMHDFRKEFVVQQLRRGKEEYGDRFKVGYGVIYSGIMGDESLLTPEQLSQDLTIATREKISEVVLFRLGGLNKKYLQVLQEFSA